MSTRARKSRIEFSDAEKANWGYWDGVNAAAQGRRPEWDRPGIYRASHPHCPAYGVAFWRGYYGETHPNTGRIER